MRYWKLDIDEAGLDNHRGAVNRNMENENEYHCPFNDDELEEGEQEHCKCGAVINDGAIDPEFDVATQWDGGCGRFICDSCLDDYHERT
jgi:hypothetical protein